MRFCVVPGEFTLKARCRRPVTAQAPTYRHPLSTRHPLGQDCEGGGDAVKPARGRAAHSSGLHMSVSVKSPLIGH